MGNGWWAETGAGPFAAKGTRTFRQSVISTHFVIPIVSSLVATRVFNVRLIHDVITLKTQTVAVNARWKRVSQLGFKVCIVAKLYD